MVAGMINRRGIIGGLIGLVAAPAIVRAGSLMPVRALDKSLILPNNVWEIGDIIHAPGGERWVVKGRALGEMSKSWYLEPEIPFDYNRWVLRTYTEQGLDTGANP